MQNRQIYDQLPAFIIVTTLSALATVALYWNDPLVKLLQLQIWLGLFLGFMLIRSVIVWRVRRRMLEDAHRAHNLVTLSAAITGLYWGAACILFNPVPFPTGTETSPAFFQQALFGALLGSQGIAALACYSASFRSFLAFCLTSLVPAMAYLMVQPSPTAHLVAGIGGLLILFLLATGRSINSTTLSSLRLRLRNEDLISFLEGSKREMEAINQKLALEIYDRKNAEVRLQEMNDNLERKVSERTQALSTLNDALRQSQERLSLAIDASGIGLWDWHLPSDEIYHSNFEQLLGYSSKELTGFMGHLKPLVHADDYPLVKKAIVLHLRKRTPIYHVQYRMRHRRGHWIWVEDNGRVVAWNEEGRGIRMIGTRRDITKERELEQRLRLSASVFHHAAEAIFILDRDLRFVSINPGFTQISGYTEAETVGTRITDPRGNTELHAQHLAIAQHMQTHDEWQGEFNDYRKNGEAYPQWLHLTAVRDESGSVTHYIGLFNDMTARREAEERLRYLSNYDKLTGFANRNLFRDRLHMAISRARDNNHQVALLYIDLDRFRQINDTLGHEVGDELLKKAAKRISSVDGTVDTISRIGGDEFTLIVDKYEDRSAIEHLCERIIAELRRPFRIGEHELLLGASIGISVFPDNGRELQILLNHADIAMHQAKRLGGNTTKFYTADLRVASIEQLNLETSLRKAIFRDEFVVHYQPKMCLKTNRILGVEALVRWNHPSLGLLYPGDFIPLAEETGLVSAIGELVLDKACRQAQQWKEMGLGDIRTSVNIPAHQVRKGNLVQVIKRVLDNSGLDPTLLELELTESSLMEDSDNVLSMLQELRGRGIVISLDDFGTGYSSLSYLKRFPIDVLKIDQAFIRDIGNSPDDEAITRAIIAMAHSMNMTVVAEGVETDAHLDFLRKEGCDYIQGYLLSRPIPEGEISQLLRRQG
ncbi:MAG: EAL domain-containing protein [Pseudomonadota bacterium]